MGVVIYIFLFSVTEFDRVYKEWVWKCVYYVDTISERDV